MIWIEVITCIADVSMALAAWYGIVSFKLWIHQTTITRRADIAKDALEELEFFYIRLEQLVQWEYHLSWIEWGQSFNVILRSHFLIGKFKTQRLNDKTINLLLEKMEAAATELPTNQRLATQVVEGTGRLFWPNEASKAKEKFDLAWKTYQESWQSLREALLSAGLYEIKKQN